MFEPLLDSSPTWRDLKQSPAMQLANSEGAALPQLELALANAAADSVRRNELVDLLLQTAEQVQAQLLGAAPDLVYLLPADRPAGKEGVRWYLGRFVLPPAIAPQPHPDSEPPAPPRQDRAAAAAAVTPETIAALEAEFDLRIDESIPGDASVTHLRAYASRLTAAFRNLPRAKAAKPRAGAAESVPVNEAAPVATIGLVHAEKAFPFAANSMNYKPILSLCSLHDCCYDMMHGHIHLVNNLLDYMMEVSNVMFACEGALKPLAERRAYAPPRGTQASSAKNWRKLGFSCTTFSTRFFPRTLS